MWKALNYPIYIPEQDRDIAPFLVKGEAAKLAAILKRRASLGSGSAAALFGFLEFMGALSGEPNPEAAIACCTGPAKAGDPYARYVLSWACWERGNRADALRWMRRSALDSKFLPARVDLGRMHAALAGNAGETRAAIRILWDAHRRGHAGALAQICGIVIRGRLGISLRLLGVVLFPYSLMRLVLVLRCEPFGVRAFIVSRDPKLPFFKSRSDEKLQSG